MSRADAWMPFYIADYLRKTMHLTRDQHGGYLLLIMACWDNGGRLPNDPGFLAATVKASPVEWRKLAPVLMRYFDVDGDYITQKRVLKEYGKAAKISAARREAGAQGGRPRKHPESKPKPNGFANEEQTETHASVALPSPTELGSPKELPNICERERVGERAGGSPPLSLVVVDDERGWLMDASKADAEILLAKRSDPDHASELAEFIAFAKQRAAQLRHERLSERAA